MHIKFSLFVWPECDICFFFSFDDLAEKRKFEISLHDPLMWGRVPTPWLKLTVLSFSWSLIIFSNIIFIINVFEVLPLIDGAKEEIGKVLRFVSKEVGGVDTFKENIAGSDQDKFMIAFSSKNFGRLYRIERPMMGAR